MASRAKLVVSRQTYDLAANDCAKEFTVNLVENISAVVDQVMWINQPDAFILEDAPLKNKAPRSGSYPRVWRSHERDIYTILTPDVIRKKLGLAEPTGDSRKGMTPHDRRRHFRTFYSDRFVLMRGKTIVIEACWVGPQEKIIGQHKYKVRVDL